MPQITLGSDLAGLYYELTNAIDEGADATTEEVQAAMEDGYTMTLLDRFFEADISLYDREERDAINRLYEANAADRSKRLGYHNNGLAYAAGVLVQIMVHGEWEDPETGEKSTWVRSNTPTRSGLRWSPRRPSHGQSTREISAATAAPSP